MAATMLSHQNSTGFYKAPVCKGLIGCMALTCTAIHVPMITNFRQYLTCEIPGILTSGSIWRILLSRLTFVYTKDVICSAFIIYYFRVFERRMGSRKFASHLLATCTTATLLEIGTIMFLKHFQVDYPNAGFLSPGLYGLIFPLYLWYFLDIPRITSSNFLGIPVTGKTMTYLLGLQVASTSVSTIISSFCGVVAGMLYKANFLRMQKWLVVPKIVANVCDKAFGWLLNSSEPKQGQMGATLELQRQEQADLMEQQYLYNRAQDFRQVRGQGFAERLIDDQPQGGDGLAGYFFRRRGPNSSRNSEPSPENIRILVDMGFDQTRATEALRSCSNDLQTATSILLRQ